MNARGWLLGGVFALIGILIASGVVVDLRDEIEAVSVANKELAKKNADLSQKNDTLKNELDQLKESNDWLDDRLEYLEDYAVMDFLFQNIYDQADYLVHLDVTLDTGFQQVPVRLSGFVIEYEGQHYILTAGHIRSPNTEVISIVATFIHDDRPQEAELVGYDSEVDVALLKFKDPDFVFEGRVAELGDSGDLRVADSVMTLGSPLGDFKWAGAVGAVTNLRVGSDYGHGAGTPYGLTQQRLIMHSALVNPGNSGGPLINSRGQVVGINVLIAGHSFNNFISPMYLAIHIDDVRDRLPDLVAGLKK